MYQSSLSFWATYKHRTCRLTEKPKNRQRQKYGHTKGHKDRKTERQKEKETQSYIMMGKEKGKRFNDLSDGQRENNTNIQIV